MDRPPRWVVQERMEWWVARRAERGWETALGVGTDCAKPAYPGGVTRLLRLCEILWNLAELRMRSTDYPSEGMAATSETPFAVDSSRNVFARFDCIQFHAELTISRSDR